MAPFVVTAALRFLSATGLEAAGLEDSFLFLTNASSCVRVFGMKKADKDKTTMTAREVAVLIEDLRGQFRVFGEGLTALREKVDSIANALANVMGRITAIELRLTRLETKG